MSIYKILSIETWALQQTETFNKYLTDIHINEYNMTDAEDKHIYNLPYAIYIHVNKHKK